MLDGVYSDMNVNGDPLVDTDVTAATDYTASVLTVVVVGERISTSVRSVVGDFVVKKKMSRGPNAAIGTNWVGADDGVAIGVTVISLGPMGASVSGWDGVDTEDDGAPPMRIGIVVARTGVPPIRIGTVVADAISTGLVVAATGFSTVRTGHMLVVPDGLPDATGFSTIKIGLRLVAIVRTELALVGLLVAVVGAEVALVGLLVAVVGAELAIVGLLEAIMGAELAVVGLPETVVGAELAETGFPEAMEG